MPYHDFGIRIAAFSVMNGVDLFSQTDPIPASGDLASRSFSPSACPGSRRFGLTLWRAPSSRAFPRP
jgi:hypothetical protein